MIIIKYLLKIFNLPFAIIFTIVVAIQIFSTTRLTEIMLGYDIKQLLEIRDYMYKVVNIYIRVLFNILIWLIIYLNLN